MKKLIIILITISLNSCTTNEDIKQLKPYTQRLYYKEPNSTTWLARDNYKPLPPAYLYAECGFVVSDGIQNNDGAIWRWEWRVECK